MKLFRNWKAKLVEQKLTKLVLPHTLVGSDRVRNLYRLAQSIEEDQIPGDVVECGVYNGGTAAILARVATRSGMNRTVWLFDSFQGMPQSADVDGPEAREYVGEVRGSIQHVTDLVTRAGADISRVRIVPGFFQETLPANPVRKIALLNIDADWYESVKICLDTFYDAIVPGGIISIDDYGHWPGCKKAVDEFFEKRGLTYPLQQVDYTARWFRKLDAEPEKK